MMQRMKLFVVAFLTVVLLAGCDFIPIPVDTTLKPSATPEETTALTEAPTPEPTDTPTPTDTSTPTPEPTATPSPTPTPAPTPPDIGGLPPEDMGAAAYTEAYEQITYISDHLGSDLEFVEEQCTYIVGQSMAMDGQTDIIFDYVEWLSNPEATVQYLLDFPSALPEDYEFIEEIGYIRNVDTSTVIHRTSTESLYYLNRPLYTSSIGEVDYDEFRDWLFLTSTNRFVIVCTVDGVIARIEWIFLP